ncbi:MAG: lipid-A-disaccharide synthase [Burkholderiales bacterium]|jgi:lipid-A-disaccharide synthase|nr:lipid-A-disaccharide synthase [Burkholderiales bacterium]MBP7519467.1 lipid-A-disaccharide synthase [Leptothrix sp. (in: b-proteobacteria)]HQY07877.1 lipid-A-disaccharide synthase [Burkholderiaceae bacterium]
MNPNSAPRLAMVAGEASGDLLASLLLGGLRERWPGLIAQGIGGPKMVAGGFDTWWPQHKLAVFGYVDALKHYREIAGIRRQLGDRLLADRPEVFIGVDAPDFNLGLEERLKAAGVPTVHFVSPSIWAWRGGRIEKIRRSADHVLCLFPFEPEIYQRAGIASTFVGHPLADEIPLQPPRAAARQALGLGDTDTVVALMPGSRRSEVRHLAPRLLAAAGLLARERPGLRFLLPVAPGLRPLIDPLVAAHAPGLNLQLLDGRSHEALAACDLTLIASGTATLEAALFKRPMVIVYHLHWLSHWLMKRMAYLPWVGLPNILAREFLVPELIQDAATPEAIAAEARRWLDDAAACDRLAARFTDMHHLLRQGTARRATDALAQVLGR